MLKKGLQVIGIISISIALLVVCVLVVSGTWRIGLYKAPPSKYNQPPVRIVSITLEQNMHYQLFDKLRKFSEANAFTIQIRQTDPTGENFLIQMSGEDIWLVGIDSGDPGIFEIGFYYTDPERPAPSSVFDELILDLQKLIAEIPNTTFTVNE